MATSAEYKLGEVLDHDLALVAANKLDEAPIRLMPNGEVVRQFDVDGNMAGAEWDAKGWGIGGPLPSLPYIVHLAPEHDGGGTH